MAVKLSVPAVTCRALARAPRQRVPQLTVDVRPVKPKERIPAPPNGVVQQAHAHTPP